MLALAVVLYRVGVPTLARFLLVTIATLAYNGLLDGGPTGQTLGKKILRIRTVADDTGGILGEGRGIGRAATSQALSASVLLHPLGVLVPLLDGLWPLWDQHRQTWHDKAVRSVVVVA